MNDFATAAGHWYAPDGAPAYTIKGANGNERATTLRDARKLGLLPSVTTIIRCAAAPALERWKRNQVLMAALTLPRRDGELEIDWLKRVDQDSQETGRKAADRGTAIHAAIEQHYRREAPEPEYWDHVKVAAEALLARCGEQEWHAERSFAWQSYAGKTDLHSAAWVIDVKTKDGDGPRELYDDHLMQLAAYRRGLGVSGARAGILFVSRDQPTAIMMEATEEQLVQGLAMFDALLAYWQAKTGYSPGATE